MKQKIFFCVLIFGLILLCESSLSNTTRKDNYGAYIKISFQSPTIFKDSSSQHMIESEIKNIFENEGIHIIHEEKPEEYKLNINILIGDSLIIEENSIGVGGGDSIVEVKHPRVSYLYKNESDIYNSIKSYIKNNF